MTIIIFLVDTSASMNQRTFLGTSLLDIAKGAVEMFMKFRSRDPASRMDRYMLLTFEDPPANIKAGWKESHATFMSELKNLTCTGLSTLGPSLKYTFDLLNVNRMQSGVDTYGQGRSPFYLEPAVIICITDGCKMTTSTNVQKELNLPMNTSVPGSSLTKEPFRWDQRLFGLVLRIPAVPPQDTGSLYIPAADDCQIDLMCDVTGGRSYMINSHRVLVKSLESLVQKVQPGVVINFEKWGPDPPPVADNEETKSSTPTPQSTNWHNCNKMIFVPRSAQRGYSIGHWPIPEAYWPDTTDTLDLPPRTAHPIVKFSCTNSDAMVVENLPFDKYEVEPSPLTQYILERRQPNIAWQVYISNSAKYSTDIGHPFGYLKPSSNLMTVNLFIMPYNYPVLLPLLDDLFKVLKGKPNMKWRHDFENYLKSMPIYYAPCLRRAMARMGAPNLIPEHMDNSLNYKVVNHLKKLKLQAKVEYDKLVTSVGQTLPVVEGIKVVPKKNNSILLRQDLQQLLNNYDGDVIAHLKQELAEYNTFTLGIPSKKVVPNTYKNPYDISRSSLLDQLTRMRSNLLHMNRPTLSLKPAKHDDDDLHSIPVQQMGNYQEYLKKMPAPLRELETAPVRQHMFGNPFKVNKNLMIDEADEAMPGQPSPSRKRQADTPPGSPMPRRRKPGPLPKDTPYRRPSTPSIESAANKYAPTLLSIDSESEKDTSDDSGMESDDSLFSLNSSGESEVIKPEPIRGAVLINEPIGNTGLLNEPIRGPLLLNKVCDTNGHIDTMHNGDSSYKAHNKLIVQKANREVKKPGKKHTVLFEHLQKLQGPVDVKCVHIRDLMHQASRFKRRQLISLLEQFEQSLLVNTNGNGAR